MERIELIFWAKPKIDHAFNKCQREEILKRFIGIHESAPSDAALNASLNTEITRVKSAVALGYGTEAPLIRREALYLEKAWRREHKEDADADAKGT